MNCQSWANLGATYPIADDRGSSIWSDFGTGAIPRNAIIDSDGVVHYNAIGYNEASVTAILNDLLTVTDTEIEIESPENHQVLSVFPNPFNAETRIQFELPTSGYVELSIYDGRGGLVRNLVASTLPGGMHSATWNSRNASGAELPSGVYVATLMHHQGRSSQKILLLK